MSGGKTYKENLRELLQSFTNLVLSSEKFYSDIAKVVSVNESEKTCTVEIIDGATIEDVRLQQVSSDMGLLLVPAVDSVVIVSYTDKTTAFVSMFSQIDRTIYQNGVNGGLVIAPELVAQLNKLTVRVDTIINAIENGVPAAGSADGGTAYQTTMKAILATIPGTEDFSNVENDKFTH